MVWNTKRQAFKEKRGSHNLLLLSDLQTIFKGCVFLCVQHKRLHIPFETSAATNYPQMKKYLVTEIINGQENFTSLEAGSLVKAAAIVLGIAPDQVVKPMGLFRDNFANMRWSKNRGNIYRSVKVVKL